MKRLVAGRVVRLQEHPENRAAECAVGEQIANDDRLEGPISLGVITAPRVRGRLASPWPPN